MGDRRYPPNRLLSWERLQRGWSYEEVGNRIRAEMARCEDVDTGLCANTVRRWEIGERWPEPRYRKHLVTIFGKTASHLGLLTPDELALCPDTEVINEFRRLSSMVNDDPDITSVSRTNVLKGLLGLGALPLLSPLLSLDPVAADKLAATGKPVTDPQSYMTIVRCHRTLYWSSPANALYESAYASTQLGCQLMRSSTSGIREALARGLAESALLTARLAFFDLGQPAVAERCFDVALAATRESGDHDLAVVVLGHMAFAPAFGRDPSKANSLLDAARQHTWHGVSPIVRSWLHCVASEAEARAGDASASRHYIDLATTAFDDEQPVPEWLDFYDQSRLDSFAGYAALIGDDKAEATSRLTRSLAGLGDNGAKQRSVVLADLASVSDVEEAAAYLHQALDALENDWYGTGFHRIREVRPILGDSDMGIQLDQRIAGVATAGTTALPAA